MRYTIDGIKGAWEPSIRYGETGAGPNLPRCGNAGAPNTTELNPVSHSKHIQQREAQVFNLMIVNAPETESLKSKGGH